MQLVSGKRITYISITFMLLLTACSHQAIDNRDWDANVLVYANLNPDGADREAIDRFNQMHLDVRIEVRDYSGQESSDAKKQLLTEILTGKIPDIIDLGVEWGTGLLPYRQMAEKGYLEDLWPYIESDADLGRERVMETPLKAAEVNGGLYMVFNSVSISTLAGAESLVGDRHSWTLEDVRSALAAMPEDSTILDYCYTKQDVFYAIFRMDLDSYIDWETGRCSFDGENFRAALEFIDQNYLSTFDWGANADVDVNEEISRRRIEGRQMLSMEDLRELARIQVLDAVFDGQAAFVGYPMEDGSTGSAFFPSYPRLAMSSICRNKEAAWDFIRQVLLPRYGKQAAQIMAFPINRNDYEKVIDAAKDRSSPQRKYELFYRGPSIVLHPATDEECQRFEDFYNSINKIELYDDNIYDIVWEACVPYFAGDKTLDETVELVQRRVSLYVNEQR